MQTFLPYQDYEESAYSLDRMRLGKQRVENLQIMTSLLERRGWVNHPATKMWRGYEWSLLLYQEAICNEWVHNFGFKDSCLETTIRLYFKHRLEGEQYHEPWWLGEEQLHISHQSNLIRKDPGYYERQFPDVPNDIPYYWPVN